MPEVSKSKRPISIPFTPEFLLNTGGHEWPSRAWFTEDSSVVAAITRLNLAQAAARQRIRERENDFYRRIFPPIPISDPTEQQASADGAISIPFADLPANPYLRGPRYRVMFDRTPHSPPGALAIQTEPAPGASAVVPVGELRGGLRRMTQAEFYNADLGEPFETSEIMETDAPAGTEVIPPTNLRVTRRPNGYHIQWDHPQPEAYDFRVERAIDEHDWELVSPLFETFASDDLQITDTEPPFGWVQYRIIAMPFDQPSEDVWNATASIASEVIWSTELINDILDDCINERFSMMFPIVNEFSLAAIRERNRMIRVMVEQMLQDRFLRETFQRAAIALPRGAGGAPIWAPPPIQA